MANVIEFRRRPSEDASEAAANGRAFARVVIRMIDEAVASRPGETLSDFCIQLTRVIERHGEAMGLTPEEVAAAGEEVREVFRANRAGMMAFQARVQATLAALGPGDEPEA